MRKLVEAHREPRERQAARTGRNSLRERRRRRRLRLLCAVRRRCGLRAALPRKRPLDASQHAALPPVRLRARHCATARGRGARVSARVRRAQLCRRSLSVMTRRFPKPPALQSRRRARSGPERNQEACTSPPRGRALSARRAASASVRSLPRRCPAAYPGRPARFRRRQRRTAVPAAPKRAATAPGSACRLLQSADAAKLYRQAKPPRLPSEQRVGGAACVLLRVLVRARGARVSRVSPLAP